MTAPAHAESVAVAMAVLDRFMAAFSASDVEGIRASFNFPHVRFHSSKVTTFPTSESFNLDIFRSTADAKDWARSVWDERRVIHAGTDKVHFDTQFSRLRADGSIIASYRSIYIVTKVDGHWGIQGRSSFAQ
ncbi:MAG: hypothetical protein ACKVP7_20750 [Hyphomicrobiaceae bacterium]